MKVAIGTDETGATTLGHSIFVLLALLIVPVFLLARHAGETFSSTTLAKPVVAASAGFAGEAVHGARQVATAPRAAARAAARTASRGVAPSFSRQTVRTGLGAGASVVLVVAILVALYAARRDLRRRAEDTLTEHRAGAILSQL